MAPVYAVYHWTDLSHDGAYFETNSGCLHQYGAFLIFKHMQSFKASQSPLALCRKAESVIVGNVLCKSTLPLRPAYR